MSTDGAVGFVQCENMTIIYNSMDSCPSGLGNDVLDFLRRWGLDRVEEMVSNFVYVSDESDGTSFYEFGEYFLDEDGRTAHIIDINKKLPVYNEICFVFDSLFCEWLYLINFDDGTLEIYEGFSKEKPIGRFSEVPQCENGYRAVTLVKTIPLNRLPPMFNNKEFLDD